MQDSAGQIRSVVGRGVRRLRASRALRRVFALGIPAAMLLAVVFLADRFRPLEAQGIQWALAAAVALPLAGLMWGLLQPVDRRRVATAIDAANGLHDRFGIAWGLTHGLTEAPAGGFAEAAVRDAVRHIPEAKAASAFPLSPPSTWRALLLALLAAAASLWLRTPEPPRKPALLPRAVAPLVDPDDLAEERAEVRALKAKAEELKDERLSDVADQLAKLVDSVDAGDMDLKRAFERIRTLENRLKEGAAKEDLEVKAVKAAMKEVAKELRQAAKKAKKGKKGKEAAAQTKKLADALDKGDLEAARKELERLSKLLENPLVPTSLLKKMADMFKSSAEKLQKKFDANMKKELSKELNKLKKLLRKQGLSEREQQRMKELQKQMAQQGQPPKGRQTNSLSSPERDPNAKAPKPKPKSGDKAQAKKPGDDKAPDKAASKKGKQGMSRSVSRLSRRMQKAGEQMEQPGEQARQQASKEMAKGAQDIKSMHRAMRRQGARKEAERRMSKLKESLRKGQKGGQRQQRAAAQRRSFRRRSGGRAGGPKQGRLGNKGERKPGGRRQAKLERRSERKKGKGGIGNQPGDDTLGKAERLKSKRKDEFVQGREQGGPMDQEVILSAAKKGFAKTGYRDVFTRYRDVAEEELATDRVPAGYRRYVYRYFDLIRPARGGGGGGAASSEGGQR